MPIAFRLTSYNLLAEAYATRRLYPQIAPEVLAWPRRAAAIVQRIARIAPDVACLQEVQADAWPALEAAFASLGYLSAYAQKRQGRPDGCALLFRDGPLRFSSAEALHFDDGIDGAEPSGHVALVGSFESAAGRVVVAGTHLRWQPATEDAEAHIGYRQARELAMHLGAMDATATATATATVICGDLNAGDESAVLGLLRERGYADAYAAAPQPTCNPNGRAARIDFIVHRGLLASTPAPLPAIDGKTPLPSASEPSDHLPISAELALREPSPR